MENPNVRLQNYFWFSYFCVLACWAANTYVEIFRYLQKGILFARLIDGRPYINDFVLWYNAAMLAAKYSPSNPINIYDPALQNEGIVSLTAPIVPELTFYVQYPPQFFALVRPMAGLGLQNAWLCWCALALLLILLALWFLCKNCGLSKFSTAFVFIAVFGSFPAWISFELGQTALYQFPAIISFWLLLRAGKPFFAGLLSGILLVKLQYIPFLIGTGLMTGRFKYLVGIVLSGASLALLSFVTVGWSNIINYPKALLFGETSDKVSGVSAVEMQNFRGELVLLTGGESHFIHLLALGLFALSFLSIVFLWMIVYPRLLSKAVFDKSKAFDLCASISALVMLIGSPHTHTHEYLSVIIPAVFLHNVFNLFDAKLTPRLRTLRILLLSFPVLSWIFFIFKFLFQLVRIQPFLIWALAVLAIVIFETFRLWSEANRKSTMN